MLRRDLNNELGIIQFSSFCAGAQILHEALNSHSEQRMFKKSNLKIFIVMRSLL